MEASRLGLGTGANKVKLDSPDDQFSNAPSSGRDNSVAHTLLQDATLKNSIQNPLSLGKPESPFASLSTISAKDAELLRDPESELSLSKALAPFAIMAGASIISGGAYYFATAASRRASRIDTLATAANAAHNEFRDAINYLAVAAGKPAEIVANSQGLLNGQMQRHLGNQIGYGVGQGKWLVKQPDGGILVKSDFGDPYVRFFRGGGFESGSNYKLDLGNFFISPRRSLHVTDDGSKIYWERGFLGRLEFKPSDAARNESWAQNVQSMVEKADAQLLRNLMLTQHQRGMNLNAGLARELRGANVKEAFAQIPKDAHPLGVGREAMVFRKTDGDVLRLTRNPFERPPELKDFLLQAKETQRGVGWQVETLPYLDKFVVGKKHIQELHTGLEKLGYTVTDGHYNNMRMLEGKAILIDPGAFEKARPMLSFWDAAKRKLRDDWQVLKSELKFK